MTDRLYRSDPYLLEFEATVVGHDQHEGAAAVLLDRTAFYAESGGQPWDTGVLQAEGRELAVRAVVERPGGLLHVVGETLPVGAWVRGRVDGERRADHRQQHHGQHLLSRAFVETAAARTVSFHLGARDCSIDLDREVTPEQVARAVRRANEVVWEARPVTVRTVTRAEAVALGVAVPEEAGDAVRLVEAAGFDLQPCGGTHPRSTGEVGVVLALGLEKHKGGARVRFACGHRAVRMADEHYALLRETGARLSAAPEAVPAAAARLLAQLDDVQKRERALQQQVLEGEAAALLASAAAGAAGGPAVLVRVFEGVDPAALRQLALQVTDRAPAIALLASRGPTVHLVFARSEALSHDVGALLQELVRELGGKGGGRGRVAQGGCPPTELLEAALARAAASVRGAAAPSEPRA